MMIGLYPRYRQIAPLNKIESTSQEFADLIKDLEDKREFEKIEGCFVIFKEGKGPVTIELTFEKNE